MSIRRKSVGNDNSMGMFYRIFDNLFQEKKHERNRNGKNKQGYFDTTKFPPFWKVEEGGGGVSRILSTLQRRANEK